MKKIIKKLKQFNLTMALLFGGWDLPAERRTKRDEYLRNELYKLNEK
jgi:hypothetical protein